MIAFFSCSAATSDHWNSFEWKRFLARIYSPKASFWDWSLRQRFEQSYCELNRPEAGDWRLEAGDWRLETGGWRLEVGGIRLVTEDHSKDVLFPPRLRVSA
jgi:hypothetical protein